MHWGGVSPVMTYPLARSAIPRMFVRRERWSGGYGVKAVPLVYPGQEVLPDQPVMRLLSSSQPDTGSGELVPARGGGRGFGVSPSGGVLLGSAAVVARGGTSGEEGRAAIAS